MLIMHAGTPIDPDPSANLQRHAMKTKFVHLERKRPYQTKTNTPPKITPNRVPKAIETVSAPPFFVPCNPLLIAPPTPVAVDLVLIVVLALTLTGVIPGIKLVLLPNTTAVPQASRLTLVPLIVTTPPGVSVVPGPRI
jgi:hypothetical protein